MVRLLPFSPLRRPQIAPLLPLKIRHQHRPGPGRHQHTRPRHTPDARDPAALEVRQPVAAAATVGLPAHREACWGLSGTGSRASWDSESECNTATVSDLTFSCSFHMFVSFSRLPTTRAVLVDSYHGSLHLLALHPLFHCYQQTTRRPHRADKL